MRATNPFSRKGSPQSKSSVNFSDDDGISPLSVYMDELASTALTHDEAPFDRAIEEDEEDKGPCSSCDCGALDDDDTPVPSSHPRTQPLGLVTTGRGFQLGQVPLRARPARRGKEGPDQSAGRAVDNTSQGCRQTSQEGPDQPTTRAGGNTTKTGEPAGRQRPIELPSMHSEDTPFDGAFDEGEKKEKPCYSCDCSAGDDTPMPLEHPRPRPQPLGLVSNGRGFLLGSAPQLPRLARKADDDKADW